MAICEEKFRNLVLSESWVLFAVLKDDLQGPAHGVNPVGFQEVDLPVGGNQPVPFSPLVALAEEQADITSGKGHVHGDMVAAQATAVITALLGLVEKGCELVGCISLAFICVLRLAHLDHSEIVALHMTGSDELDDVGAGEPTVSQDVVEVYLLLDDTTDHLHHQHNLALVVFLDALGCMEFLCMFLEEACVELLLLQAIVLFLPLLSERAKSTNIWLKPSVMPRKRALKPSTMEWVTCENTLPISSVWMPRLG